MLIKIGDVWFNPKSIVWFKEDQKIGVDSRILVVGIDGYTHSLIDNYKEVVKFLSEANRK